MKLSINNFQSIKSAQLDLSGFSVISGNSDLGKSAVRRAISSALFNDWSKTYQRTGTTETSVSLTTKNISVSFKKSSSKNEFVVNGKHIPKIGKDKPEIPNIRPDLNITTQLEPLFMVAYKDTENTKILNNIFGIDLLEAAQRLCSSDLRNNKIQCNQLEVEVKDQRKELEDLEADYNKRNELVSFLREIIDVKELVSDFSQVKESSETFIKESKEAQKELDALNNRITTLKDYGNLSMFIECENRLGDLYKESDNVETGHKLAQHKSDTLTKALLLREFLSISEEIEQLNSSSLENTTDTEKIEQDISTLKNYGNLKNYMQVSKNIAQLEEQLESYDFGIINMLSLLLEFNQNADKISGLKSELKEVKSELASISEQFKEYTCPECGRLLGDCE